MGAEYMGLDDDIAITAEKMSTILKAADVKVKPYWPGLFAKALEGIDAKALISSVGSGAGSAPAAGGAAVAEAAPAVAVEKKEEKKKSRRKKMMIWDSISSIKGLYLLMYNYRLCV